MNQLEQTLAAFDAANAQDPNIELVNGQPIAKELIYSQRMTEHLHKFLPNPLNRITTGSTQPTYLPLENPRNDYPMDRPGYKKWRLDLAVFHGETAGTILAENGYSDELIQRVKDLLLKRSLKRDQEVQALEDVVCLVFLEFYLEDFASKHDEEKLIDIIQKPGTKMSDAGHDAALKLPFSDAMLALVTKALQP